MQIFRTLKSPGMGLSPRNLCLILQNWDESAEYWHEVAAACPGLSFRFEMKENSTEAEQIAAHIRNILPGTAGILHVTAVGNADALPGQKTSYSRSNSSRC